MNTRHAFDLKSLLLLACYLLGSATLTIIAPILPYLMEEKDISTHYNSIIFGMFSISGLFTSIYASKFLAKHGCKLYVYAGLLGLATAHLIYSQLPRLDANMFVMVAIMNRALEGCAFGLIASTIYGVSSQELPSKQFDNYAKIWSASAGLGCSLSLMCSSMLFSIGGYDLPYYVMSAGFVTLALIIYASNILSEDNQRDTAIFDGSEADFLNDSHMTEYSFKREMTHKFALNISNVRYGWLSIIISNMGRTYLDPIIALKLLSMGIYADTAGYVIVFFAGSYCFFGFMSGFLEVLFEKKALIYMGYVVGWIAFVIIGHSAFLDKNYLPLILIGLFMNGFSVIGGNTFATMYTKNELMKVALSRGYDKQTTGGYFGGLKGCWNLIGTFIGPFVSPHLYITLGFNDTCFVMASIHLLFLGVFASMTQEEKPRGPPPQSEIEFEDISKLSII